MELVTIFLLFMVAIILLKISKSPTRTVIEEIKEPKLKDELVDELLGWEEFKKQYRK